MYLSAPQIFYSRFKIFYSRFYGRLFSCSATFDCVDHNKLWKYLKEIGIPDHLTYLLRNLHVGQEAAVRTGHGTINGSKFRKECVKAIYCQPAYLTSM